MILRTKAAGDIADELTDILRVAVAAMMARGIDRETCRRACALALQRLQEQRQKEARHSPRPTSASMATSDASNLSFGKKAAHGEPSKEITQNDASTEATMPGK